jgi:alanine dehydrogenase
MKIGVPKEMKTLEFRVGLTPAHVHELVELGHSVYVQYGAGIGSGYADLDYEDLGAIMVNQLHEVYHFADLIVKIKEPQEEEYTHIKPRHTLFTYLHLAASPKLTETLVQSGATCIAYEEVERVDGFLPLLHPMSEIAGRLSVIEGAKYLEHPFGGKGKLLSGTSLIAPARVVVLGGGTVGLEAARMAIGWGANVLVLDKNPARIHYLQTVLPTHVQVVISDEKAIFEALKTADLVIGAVLVPGKEAPKLIRREHLALMEPGTVLVDVAIDQGGCFETSRPTTHQDPVYEVDGIVHYCVANMPGSVPRTATEALNQATFPYVLELANKGTALALAENTELAKGLVIEGGVLIVQS